jgi:hypothetical protein
MTLIYYCISCHSSPGTSVHVDDDGLLPRPRGESAPSRQWVLSKAFRSPWPYHCPLQKGQLPLSRPNSTRWDMAGFSSARKPLFWSDVTGLWWIHCFENYACFIQLRSNVGNTSILSKYHLHIYHNYLIHVIRHKTGIIIDILGIIHHPVFLN